MKTLIWLYHDNLPLINFIIFKIYFFHITILCIFRLLFCLFGFFVSYFLEKQLKKFHPFREGNLENEITKKLYLLLTLNAKTENKNKKLSKSTEKVKHFS